MMRLSSASDLSKKVTRDNLIGFDVPRLITQFRRTPLTFPIGAKVFAIELTAKIAKCNRTIANCGVTESCPTFLVR